MENHQFSQCPATPEIQTCSCLAPAADRLSKVKAYKPSSVYVVNLVVWSPLAVEGVVKGEKGEQLLCVAATLQARLAESRERIHCALVASNDLPHRA
jgi:hypothetical protein